MEEDFFLGKTIVVSGGAGFVGSNLVKKLSLQNPARIFVVDNLLSSEEINIKGIPKVDFIRSSIANDDVLEQISKERPEYIFHLATYHGNQSSIHDPIADHDNNLITSIKLFDKFKFIKLSIFA